MSHFVLPVLPRPSVAIAGANARFPVRRIFCVGLNFSEHARELGFSRAPPFFFTKPADALVEHGARLPFPVATNDLRQEAELVLALSLGGAQISPEQALDHIWGYAVGNDLTRGDLQNAAIAARQPWDLAKGFDHSAICGPLHPVLSHGHVKSGQITAHINGKLRQRGEVADMIWSAREIIANLSNLVSLAAGDLIYCGSPAGRGAIVRGDSCKVAIDELGQVETKFL